MTVIRPNRQSRNEGRDVRGPRISGSVKSVGEALQRQQALGPVADGADDGLVPMVNQTHPPQRPSCHPTGWRLVLIDVVLRAEMSLTPAARWTCTRW